MKDIEFAIEALRDCACRLIDTDIKQDEHTTDIINKAWDALKQLEDLLGKDRIKACLWCKENFIVKNKTQVFCSKRCVSRYNLNKREE